MIDYYTVKKQEEFDKVTKPKQYKRIKPRVDRNGPCPCGSELKAKKCCYK
jgi:uncharacterized protein YchJ